MVQRSSNREYKRRHLNAAASYMANVPAYLPKERDSVVSELQYIIDEVREEEMMEYRRNLKSLG